MKRLKSFIIALLLISTSILFSACSNASLPAIDMNVYFKNVISSTIYKNNTSSSKSLTLDTLTKSKPDSLKMDKYLDFTLTSIGSWTYKMFVEKIEFFVISNETADSEFTITLTMTNMANEANISSTEKIILIQMNLS